MLSVFVSCFSSLHTPPLNSFSTLIMFSLLPICVPVCRSSCVPLSLPQVLTPVLSTKHGKQKISAHRYHMSEFFRFCCVRISWISWWPVSLADFIIFLCWWLGLWISGDARSIYLSLGLSCLGDNFIPDLLFDVCIFREFWLSVSVFTDLFGGYVQEGVLAKVEK